MIPNDFWHIEQIYNFDPYNVSLAPFIECFIVTMEHAIYVTGKKKSNHFFGQQNYND